MDDTSATPAARPSNWRIVLAAILDFLTAFFMLGYIVGALFGGLTDNGFSLSGAPALLCFALIVAYFWIGGKYLGGTIWQRILKAR
ncbi:hypothetical protein DFR52_101636 [Hoeflea marina]|uniref:RDD family protein n=1 Tax=Hoeflea marina TaxID=274592 RepID=A0A317PSR2_9HYPH|nr:hypothetical protein [Hoeflea marina]PWW03947.1 hypothetical protein DFR52_101636 [Hoeflea marina]